MQAMTKIFPVFFGVHLLHGCNAGATLYFVVSNIWRIGQQHLVLGKIYDQAIAAGDLKPKAGGPHRPRRARRQGTRPTARVNQPAPRVQGIRRRVTGEDPAENEGPKNEGPNGPTARRTAAAGRKA